MKPTFLFLILSLLFSSPILSQVQWSPCNDDPGLEIALNQFTSAKSSTLKPVSRSIFEGGGTFDSDDVLFFRIKPNNCFTSYTITIDSIKRGDMQLVELESVVQANWFVQRQFLGKSIWGEADSEEKLVFSGSQQESILVELEYQGGTTRFEMDPIDAIFTSDFYPRTKPIQISHTNESCPNALDGSIQISAETVFGVNLKIKWESGETTFSRSNLGAGVYKAELIMEYQNGPRCCREISVVVNTNPCADIVYQEDLNMIDGAPNGWTIFNPDYFDFRNERLEFMNFAEFEIPIDASGSSDNEFTLSFDLEGTTEIFVEPNVFSASITGDGRVSRTFTTTRDNFSLYFFTLTGGTLDNIELTNGEPSAADPMNLMPIDLSIPASIDTTPPNSFNVLPGEPFKIADKVLVSGSGTPYTYEIEGDFLNVQSSDNLNAELSAISPGNFDLKVTVEGTDGQKESLNFVVVVEDTNNYEISNPDDFYCIEADVQIALDITPLLPENVSPDDVQFFINGQASLDGIFNLQDLTGDQHFVTVSLPEFIANIPFKRIEEVDIPDSLLRQLDIHLKADDPPFNLDTFLLEGLADMENIDADWLGNEFLEDGFLSPNGLSPGRYPVTFNLNWFGCPVSDTAFVTIDPFNADVEVKKTGIITDQLVCLGDSVDLEFELLVRNNGPDLAESILLFDVLKGPFSMDQITVSNPNMTCKPGSGNGNWQLDCTMSSLAAKDSVLIKVKGRTTAPDGIENSVLVTSVTNDPMPENNQDSIALIPNYQNANLEIEVFCPSENNYCSGELIQTEIQIKNPGELALEQIEFTAAGGPGVQFNWKEGGQLVVNEGGELVVLIPELGAGQTMVITYETDGVPGENTISNKVIVLDKCVNGQGNFIQNCQFTVELCSALELGLKVLPDPIEDITPETIFTGHKIGYEIEVDNLGLGNAEGVSIELSLSDSLEFENLNEFCMLFPAEEGKKKVRCDLGNIGTQEKKSLTISAYAREAGNYIADAWILQNDQDLDIGIKRVQRDFIISDDKEYLKDLFQTYLREQYPELTTQFYRLYGAAEELDFGGLIHSQDSSQFSEHLNRGMRFAWIDWYPNDLFEHPSSYFIINPANNNIRAFDQPLWWPSLPDFPNNNPFREEDLILENYFLPQASLNPSAISDSINISTENDSTCTLIFTGHEDRRLQRMALQKAGQQFKQELHNEKLGPRLDTSRIKSFYASSDKKMKEEIAKLKGYKKIYFYYVGHSSKISAEKYLLAASEKSSEWVDVKEIFEELKNTNAKKVCMVLDACFAGTAMDIFKKSGKPELGQSFEIYTSTNAEKFANLTGAINAKGDTLFTARFSKLWLDCHGEAAADKDKKNGTSFAETFNWIIEKNEKLYAIEGDNKKIKSFQCPQCLSGPERTTLVPGQKYSNQDHNISFSLEGLENGNDTLTISSFGEYRLELGQLPNDTLLQIDLNRRWVIDPFEETANRNFTGTLRFEYLPALDALDLDAGTLGIVKRKEGSADWEYVSGAIFNADSLTVSVPDVSSFSEWTFAIINTNVTNTYTLQDQLPLKVFPNPGVEVLFLEFELKQAERVNIGLFDLHGKRLSLLFRGKISAGKQFVQLQVNDLVPGLYILRLETPTQRTSKKLIIQHRR